ncbi:MAG: FkbM family methyltransferase [Saprospiraceae bacterium]|nr:FkbM family methyltransferase [Candidatus Vicinibacter affinis]MBK7798002.1 FkbM family methyltransferase [Candidatus Vicinibacter affinis]MBK9642514.1 FkbM family methyltransferase [Candidatus Vicinibacter affinis]
MLLSRYRQFQKYAEPGQSFFGFIIKSFWINLIKKRVFINWEDHIKWVVDSRFQSSKNPYYYKHPEKAEFEMLTKLLNKGDVFYDIGSNVGLYSIYLAVKCNIKCYAFEPDEQAATINRLNQELNSVRHLVEIFPFAISDVNGFSQFTSGLDINNKIDSIHGVKIIQTKNLDSFVHLPKPHAIKIDTEGHELMIIRGASSILENGNLRLIILEYNHLDIQDIIKIMCNYQFVPVTLVHGNMKLNTNLPPTISGNLFFVRSELIA